MRCRQLPASIPHTGVGAPTPSWGSVPRTTLHQVRHRLSRSAPAIGLLWLSSIVGGAVPAQGASPPAHGTERGAYEWDDSTWWPDPSSYTEKLTRLKTLGVTTLYVDITAAVSMEQSHSAALATFLSDFESLVNTAGTDGFRVDAVGGDPTWATSDRKGPTALLAAVAQIETALAPGALDGVQFDVEPWGLAGWRAHKAGYARDWLRFVQMSVTTWTHEALSGRLGFTVPYWFDGDTGGVPPVTWAGSTNYPFQLALGILAPLADTALNVMAYRNSTAGANGSVALFAGNMQAAMSAHSATELLAGQETGAASPAEVTFYGTSCVTFDTAATQIADAFDGDALYGGIAVDDVESLEALCPA